MRNHDIQYSEKAIAKKALAALTILRQGCNPFDTKALNRFTEADKAFPKCCEKLSIPTDYSNTTLDFLQRISR